jgi:mRNA-degrading endonuclease toxin of MazEF toxin-antitoxin module
VTTGEVYWVELSSSRGRAQAGRRPAIILQSVISLPTILVVPLTSNLDSLRFPGTVLIEKDKRNGLSQTSVALVFQLTAVDKRSLSHRLGVVSEELVESIWQSFDEITGRR